MALTAERIETQPAPPPAADAANVEKPASRRKWALLAIVLVSVAAAAAAMRGWPLVMRAQPSQIVKASGRIEGREVTIAPKDIQGRVTRLLADEGQTVTRGQLLAELDAAQLDARYASVSAAVAALDAQIAQAQIDIDYTAKSSAATIAAAEAAVSSANARTTRANAVLANARSEYERGVALYADKVISERERDQFELAVKTSEADVDFAAKDLVRAEANLTLARASADTIALKRQQLRALQQQREAAIGQRAETAASAAERRLWAPADGTILSRPVEVGDVVNPGSAVFVLVDMNRLYLKVYVPEPDIPKLRLGDPVDVTVDAFPGRRFPARVSRISAQAEFTPKNVETAEERLKLVFGVELALTNTDGLLKPGMPADCVIHWQPGRPVEAAHGS